MARLAAIALGALLGCTPVHAAEEADFAAIVRATVSGYIVPAYDGLRGATENLEAAIAELCTSPSPATRGDVASAFAETLEAWAGVDFLRFGPMAEDGRLERFAYWPDVHNTGARQMRRFLAEEDAALLEAGALAGQSAAVQGLPALESLLWSGDDALLVATSPKPYRCALAGAVAANLETIAAEAQAGWAPGETWDRLIAAPEPDNPLYRTQEEAATEILKAIATGLEQLRDHRLLPAVGETAEDARASRAPYNRSGESLGYIDASADALESYVEASGLLPLVSKEHRWIGESVRFQFGKLKASLAAAGLDLDAALADPQLRDDLVEAAALLQRLRDNFASTVSSELGITAGFNALDSD